MCNLFPEKQGIKKQNLKQKESETRLPEKAVLEGGAMTISAIRCRMKTKAFTLSRYGGSYRQQSGFISLILVSVITLVLSQYYLQLISEQWQMTRLVHLQQEREINEWRLLDDVNCVYQTLLDQVVIDPQTPLSGCDDRAQVRWLDYPERLLIKRGHTDIIQHLMIVPRKAQWAMATRSNLILDGQLSLEPDAQHGQCQGVVSQAPWQVSAQSSLFYDGHLSGQYAAGSIECPLETSMASEPLNEQSQQAPDTAQWLQVSSFVNQSNVDNALRDFFAGLSFQQAQQDFWRKADWSTLGQVSDNAQAHTCQAWLEQGITTGKRYFAWRGDCILSDGVVAEQGIVFWLHNGTLVCDHCQMHAALVTTQDSHWQASTWAKQQVSDVVNLFETEILPPHFLAFGDWLWRGNLFFSAPNAAVYLSGQGRIQATKVDNAEWGNVMFRRPYGSYRSSTVGI